MTTTTNTTARRDMEAYYKSHVGQQISEWVNEPTEAEPVWAWAARLDRAKHWDADELDLSILRTKVDLAMLNFSDYCNAEAEKALGFHNPEAKRTALANLRLYLANIANTMKAFGQLGKSLLIADWAKTVDTMIED